jgi:transcriptional regulator with XRE-family HTH domain
MFHEAILQPNVVTSQQLIVVMNAGNITTMSSNEKYAFSVRMNKVADLLNIPPKGQNRQKRLGDMFHVSQESARKWLEGESFPTTEKSIEIAKKAGVNYEWLMTGRGPEAILAGSPAAKTPEDQVLHVIQVMQGLDAQTKYKLLIQITQRLAESDSARPQKDQQSEEPERKGEESATSEAKPTVKGKRLRVPGVVQVERISARSVNPKVRRQKK